MDDTSRLRCILKYDHIQHFLSEDDVLSIEAAIDLLESVQIDNTAGVNDLGGDDESCFVVGNVSTKTLRALGFDIPKE
jgi:hypothetical protein